MKKIYIFATLLLTATITFAFDFNSITKSVTDSFSNTNTESPRDSKSTLSNSTISTGLKEALKVGVDYAVKELGQNNGYLNNNNVKIPLPENLQKVETIINKAGGEKLTQDLINSMNKAASKAAPKTAKIFLDAINNMSLEDANKILNGSENAATDYFNANSSEALKKMIMPIIQETMKENSVASYYNTINDFYKKNAKQYVQNSSLMSMAKSYGIDTYLPGSSDVSLDEYVTQKAIDGLFTIIALKEAKIRKNPIEQTTSILKQVFGN